jgi:hypothetical protein
LLSPLTGVLGVAVLLLMLSQFGGRLAARNAIVWWLGMIFFMLSAIVPQAFRPLADLLGIEFVSNLILASMILFLLYQMIEQMSVSTGQTRGHRQLVSRIAARDFLARRPPLPAVDGQRPDRVLIVLPCYNEAAILPSIIQELDRLVSTHGVSFDYCIVNDGSWDRSEIVLRELAPRHHANHMSNIGVAGVLLTGFRIASELDYDYVVQCDADGQHPVVFIPTLVERARAAGADLFVGSRFSGRDRDLEASQQPTTTFLRRTGALLILNVLRLFGPAAAVSDPTSGFRVFSRRFCDLASSCMPDEYPEPELLALAAVHGGTVGETKVDMVPRAAGQSSIGGLGVIRYMVKVITALLGLRLRTFSRLNLLARRS